jgi:hypothetical protein
MADSGHIVGRPTLLVTFGSRLDGQALMSVLGGVGYPVVDVRIYYRPQGTDQVIDALTGEVPAGAALSREAASSHADGKLDTLLLLHPDPTQFVAVRGALAQFGEADYKYSEATVFEGQED